MTTRRCPLSILGATGLVLLGAGCNHLDRSEAGAIQGVVQYPSGTFAVHAGVSVAEGTALVYTGPTGTFTLPVKGSPGDTVIVRATDGCDGRVHACVNLGSSRVVLRKSATGTIIVLSECVPI